jgi:hypothetical protein
MTRERRASERARAGAILTLAAATCALGACRQTVILDQAAGLDGGATAGSGGGLDAAVEAPGGSAGSGGGNRFDGGRSDGFDSCLGEPIQQLRFSLRAPDVVFSVDRSAAMQQSWTADGSRLQLIQSQIQALIAKYADPKSDNPSVRFGYGEFPSTTGGPCGAGQGCCAGDVTPPSQHSLGAIGSLLKGCNGSGCIQSSRPTANALSRANAALSMLNDGGHSHYVILLTGGDPTCMSNDPSATPCDNAATEVERLDLQSIPTIVFGVGDEATGDACLDLLATRGGRPLTSASPPHYHLALTPTDLSAALAPVVEGMAEEACHVALNMPSSDTSKVELVIDNVFVPVDGVDGWTFDPNDNVQLTVHGSWCSKLLASNHIEVISGCRPPHN